MSSSCINRGGKLCPPGGSANPCNSFQLTNTSDNCLIDQIVSETVMIGGAPLNVYKLLGVAARSTPQDITGVGKATSGGAIAGFSAQGVFDGSGTFRSTQRGSGVASSAWIGFDFGEIKTSYGTPRYGIETYANRMVSAVTITQSTCPSNRADKLRVERSPDGIKWYGVDVITSDGTHTIRASVPSRFWRVRPITFVGGEADYWEVVTLHFHDSQDPRIDNIQDAVLFENRDREYQQIPVTLKGRFDHQDAMLELAAHGMMLPEMLVIEVSFSQCVAALGRPLVIGDLIELPTEVMYDPSMRPVKKYVEVQDVAWSTNGYTPGWVPTLLRVTTQPAIASRETRDVLGPLASSQVDPSGLFDVDDGLATPKPYQDYSEITQTIRAEAHTAKPLDGIDQSEVGQPTVEQLQDVANRLGDRTVQQFVTPQKGLYIEDALPPNGEPYTEGDELPPSAKDGAYHRVTYTGMAEDIPARLYRYSGVKRRWIYVETDKRAMHRHATTRVRDQITGSKKGQFDQ